MVTDAPRHSLPEFLLHYQQKEPMKNNTQPCRVVVGLALGILVVFGSLSTVSGVIPPTASVSVTPSCTSYTITVSASGVPPNGTVSYSITATPTSGSPITISDSIVVGNGNTTLTKPLGPLNGAYTFSGSFSTNFAILDRSLFRPAA